MHTCAHPVSSKQQLNFTTVKTCQLKFKKKIDSMGFQINLMFLNFRSSFKNHVNGFRLSFNSQRGCFDLGCAEKSHSSTGNPYGTWSKTVKKGPKWSKKGQKKIKNNLKQIIKLQNDETMMSKLTLNNKHMNNLFFMIGYQLTPIYTCYGSTKYVKNIINYY